jgi:hypothetical protein
MRYGDNGKSHPLGAHFGKRHRGFVKLTYVDCTR